MQKKEWFILGLFVTAIIGMFINKFAILNRTYEEKVEGLLTSKEPRGRGSFRIEVRTSSQRSTKHRYDGMHVYDQLIIGDSVFKFHRSKYLNLFRKGKGDYFLVDSFKITPW